jgi:hypothetical protein
MLGYKLVNPVPMQYFLKWYFKPECTIIGGCAVAQLAFGVYTLTRAANKPDIHMLSKSDGTETTKDLIGMLYAPR